MSWDWAASSPGARWGLGASSVQSSERRSLRGRGNGHDVRLTRALAKALARSGRFLRRMVRGRSPASPAEVVKANTREAFDFFFAQDEYIADCYLQPSRLAFYETVADYCAGVLPRPDDGSVPSVVDIGCGTGHALAALSARLGKGGVEFYGLDFAGSALEKARKLLPESRFVNEDLHGSSLPSGRFDLVLCLETLEHLHRPQNAIRELVRLCKVGGSIVITVPNGEKDSWDV